MTTSEAAQTVQTHSIEMTNNVLDKLAGLLEQESENALRARANASIPEALVEGSPPAHGIQRVEDGFDIIEVVAEYNILRGCIHELADQHGLTLRDQTLHIVNRVLDEAIGLAVQAFSTQRALEMQCRREEYLTFVAHDLRTPLNAISLAGNVLELMLPSDALTSEVSQTLKSLKRNTKHLETLVSKVLEENSHLQTKNGVKLVRRSFDLWPLVESLIHDLRVVAGKGSTRLLNHVPSDLVVFADADLLRRVLQNLIANAIRYAPAGQVIIGAKHVDGDDSSGGASAVECWVSDDGAGIAKELLARVFEAGETDHIQSGGSGFGLAIVKSFVEAHGGEVTVESTDGQGSCFRFFLPSCSDFNQSGKIID
jgi:two-component system, OmpR family, phosphate regulon sensor histidine kinase PhoR